MSVAKSTLEYFIGTNALADTLESKHAFKKPLTCNEHYLYITGSLWACRMCAFLIVRGTAFITCYCSAFSSSYAVTCSVLFFSGFYTAFRTHLRLYAHASVDTRNLLVSLYMRSFLSFAMAL